MAFPVLGIPRKAFFDSNGEPLNNGTLTITDPNTLLAKSTYSTAADADVPQTPNASVITLNQRGEPATEIWGIDGQEYRIELKDSNGTQIWVSTDIAWDVTSVANTEVHIARTAAEAAAGITAYVKGVTTMGNIVNPWYAPGDVRRYGAVANEAATTTNSVNTAAIQAALDSNGYVWFQPGAVYMTGMLHPDSNQIIDLNKCTLRLLAGVSFYTDVISMTPETVFRDHPNFPWYRAGIDFLDNVVIKNGTIDGNVANNLAPTLNPYGPGSIYPGTPSTTANSNNGGISGIHLSCNTTNIAIEKIRSANFFTDGICFSHQNNGTGDPPVPSYVTVTDCDLDTNGRQGSSMGGINVQFTRCKFRNTNAPGSTQRTIGIQGGSHTGAAGVTYNTIGGPWAGVDIEPYWDVYNVSFMDCEFSGNGGKGLVCDIGSATTFHDLNVDSCRMFQNGLVLGSGDEDVDVALSCRGGSKFRDINFSNCHIEAKLHCGGFYPGLADFRVNVSNCTIGSGLKYAPFRLRATGNDSVFNFSNCEIWGLRNDNSAGGTIDLASTRDTTINITGGSMRNAGTGVGILCNGQSAATNLSAAEALGQILLSVDSEVGFADGDMIGIVRSDTYIHWTTVNGTPVPASGEITILEPLLLDALDNAIVYRGRDKNSLVLSGVQISGGSNGMLNTGAWDVHFTGGTIISDMTNYGAWNYNNNRANYPKIFTGDCTFKDCSTGVRSEGFGGIYDELQVSGSRFIDCGIERTTIDVKEAAGQTIISVVDESSFVALDPIGIAMDNGDTHWTTVVSTVSGPPDTITIAVAIPYPAALGNKVYSENNHAGVTLISELRGYWANPNTKVTAGKGSTYQSLSDGTMWRNTNSATAWTAM